MDRREELCGKALEYFLEHGLANLSLRPLAEKIGTSARLLIFHFGSKDGLVSAVMAEVRLRMQASFTTLMRESRGQANMESFWAWTISPSNSAYVRLLFEVQVLALQNPAAYAHYLEGGSASWLAVIEGTLLPSPNRRAIATLCVAVIDGLVLEYFSTGDLDRTTEALRVFVSLLDAAQTKN